MIEKFNLLMSPEGDAGGGGGGADAPTSTTDDNSSSSEDSNDSQSSDDSSDAQPDIQVDDSLAKDILEGQDDSSSEDDKDSDSDDDSSSDAEGSVDEDIKALSEKYEGLDFEAEGAKEMLELVDSLGLEGEAKSQFLDAGANFVNQQYESMQKEQEAKQEAQFDEYRKEQATKIKEAWGERDAKAKANIVNDYVESEIKNGTMDEHTAEIIRDNAYLANMVLDTVTGDGSTKPLGNSGQTKSLQQAQAEMLQSVGGSSAMFTPEQWDEYMKLPDIYK